MYNWTDGELITAEKLNQTGNIFYVNMILNDETEAIDLDKSWNQLKNAYKSGKTIIFRLFNETPSSEAPEMYNQFTDFKCLCVENMYVLYVNNVDESTYTFEANTPDEPFKHGAE